MEHLKTFSTTAQYDAAKQSLALPNVSITSDNGSVHANPERGLYFKFATTGTVTITIPASVSTSNVNYVEWSVNKGKTWNKTVNTSSEVVITTSSASEVWVRGKAVAYGTDSAFTTMIPSASCEVGGNIMSLLYGDANYNEYVAFPSGSSFTFYGLFNGSTQIKNASGLLLPATSLVASCYAHMFYGCSNMTEGPELPATSLAASCYDGLFQNCSNLLYSPELPATTLATSCYANMLRGCAALKVAPKLPAMNAVQGCYSYMLAGCTSLVICPELPATTIGASCYSNMLNGCASLKAAPKILPATTLQNNCYASMFYGCSSLENAPELPAITLVSGCYDNMFYGCSHINHIEAAFITTPSSSYTNSWLAGVAATGTFIKNANATWTTTGTSAAPTSWTARKKASLKLTAASSATFTITVGANCPVDAPREFGYSTDGWNFTVVGRTPGTAQTLTVTGTTVYIYAAGHGTSNGYGQDSSMVISCTSAFSASGDMSSMRDNGAPFCFAYLFSGSTITVAPSLSDTTLYPMCYAYMFKNCTGLTSAPALPATVMEHGCYQGMFYGCTGLSVAPSLPATTLESVCYSEMFYGCTGITSAPALPATTLEMQVYDKMFMGCTGLTAMPTLAATTLSQGCYARMFRGCTRITTASLPATKMVSRCYEEMFYGCSALNTVTMRSLTEPHAQYTNNWLYGVASSGTFNMSSSAAWLTLSRGATWVPVNWTVNRT